MIGSSNHFQSHFSKRTHIELLELNENSEDQKLLALLLRQKKSTGKLGKAVNNEGFEVIHQLEDGRQLTLSHSIMIMQTDNGDLIYTLLDSEEDPDEEEVKRKTLGKGSFGSAIQGHRLDIYENKQEIFVRLNEDQERVVKKIKIHNDNQVKRVQQEFDLAQKIKRLDVQAKLQLSGKSGNQVTYIEMKKAPGKPLSKILERDNLSISERFKISIGILTALQELHEANIVHRDIKLDNIIVNLEPFEVTIIDFGCAEEKKASVRARGTSSYMPLEALKAKKDQNDHIVDTAIDVYSVHCVLSKIWGGTDNAPNPREKFDKFYQFLNKGSIRFNFDKSPVFKLFLQHEKKALYDVLQRGLKNNLDERVTLLNALQSFKKLHADYVSRIDKKLSNIKETGEISENSREIIIDFPRDDKKIIKVNPDDDIVEIARPANSTLSLHPARTGPLKLSNRTIPIYTAYIEMAKVVSAGTLYKGVALTAAAIPLTAAVGAALSTTGASAGAVFALSAAAHGIMTGVSAVLGIHAAVALVGALGTYAAAAVATGGLLVAVTIAVTAIALIGYGIYRHTHIGDKKNTTTPSNSAVTAFAPQTGRTRSAVYPDSPELSCGK